jgi:hypothetical protein
MGKDRRYSSMPDRRSRAHVLAGAALALAIAGPAVAGDIYTWRTDDGGYAFADDPKRVPEKYRGRVTIRQSGSLSGHARYTPEDDAAQNAYARELEQRLETLRRTNAALEAQAARSAAAANAGESVSVRLSSDGEPTVDIPQSATGGAPVVIEDVVALRDGANRTRTNTVIRRGDEVIAVIRNEEPNLSLYYPRESEVERGDY